MIAAILDTNVLVQSIIGSPRSASARVREAYYDGRFQLAVSPATFDELIDVLTLPSIRKRHGFSDDEILECVESLLPNAVTYRFTITGQVTSVLDQSVEVRALLGDVTDSGAVNASDRSVIVGVWTGAATR